MREAVVQHPRHRHGFVRKLRALAREQVDVLLPRQRQDERRPRRRRLRRLRHRRLPLCHCLARLCAAGNGDTGWLLSKGAARCKQQKRQRLRGTEWRSLRTSYFRCCGFKGLLTTAKRRHTEEKPETVCSAVPTTGVAVDMLSS